MGEGVGRGNGMGSNEEAGGWIGGGGLVMGGEAHPALNRFGGEGSRRKGVPYICGWQRGRSRCWKVVSVSVPK